MQEQISESKQIPSCNGLVVSYFLEATSFKPKAVNLSIAMTRTPAVPVRQTVLMSPHPDTHYIVTQYINWHKDLHLVNLKNFSRKIAFIASNTFLAS